jgi:hypothetical protein
MITDDRQQLHPSLWRIFPASPRMQASLGPRCCASFSNWKMTNSQLQKKRNDKPELAARLVVASRKTGGHFNSMYEMGTAGMQMGYESDVPESFEMTMTTVSNGTLWNKD